MTCQGASFTALLYTLQYLVGGARSLLRPTFHEALEADGAVFTGKMDVSLLHALVAAEERVLADEPAGVAAEQIGIAGRVAQRGRAGIVLLCPRPDFFQLFDESIGILLYARVGSGCIWPVWLVGCPDMAACEIDNDAGLAGLAARDIPCILEADIGIDVAIADARPRARAVPVARIKLQLQFGVRAIAKLRDGRLFQVVETGPAVIQRAQNAEGNSQHDVIKRLLPLSTGGREGDGDRLITVGFNGNHSPVELYRPCWQAAGNSLR